MSNVLSLKAAFDDLRLALRAPQVRPELAYRFRLALRALTTDRIALHILVE